MRFGAYETAPQRVHTATGLGVVLPLALFSCSSRTAFRSGRFSFGHEWVGGGGNSLSFTGVLGQSNGQESHTYRNRSGKTCLFSSDIGPHLAYWATQPKASRLLSILRQQIAHPAITDAAISLLEHLLSVSRIVVALRSAFPCTPRVPHLGESDVFGGFRP